MYKKTTKTKTIKETNSAVVEPNDIDIIAIDVPLMIRLLEYAREDAVSDVDLHNLTTNLIKSSKDNKHKALDMAIYEKLIQPSKTE